MKHIISITGVFLILACDPFVTEFPDSSDPVMLKAADVSDTTYVYDSLAIKVVTWNIRFGIGRFPFFGDSCGDSVIADNESVEANMVAIAEAINAMDADIVLLQEVDLESKRTGYLNQVQYLLDNTYLNYGSYASMCRMNSRRLPVVGLQQDHNPNTKTTMTQMSVSEKYT